MYPISFQNKLSFPHWHFANIFQTFNPFSIYRNCRRSFRYFRFREFHVRFTTVPFQDDNLAKNLVLTNFLYHQRHARRPPPETFNFSNPRLTWIFQNSPYSSSENKLRSFVLCMLKFKRKKTKISLLRWSEKRYRSGHASLNFKQTFLTLSLNPNLYFVLSKHLKTSIQSYQRAFQSLSEIFQIFTF